MGGHPQFCKKFISQLFEELQGLNLEFKLIALKAITGNFFYTIWPYQLFVEFAEEIQKNTHQT